MASTLIGKQAVVIGAGMGGLAAAGALADCFEQVFVLERDTLPSEPAYRVGTPQARHVHALLLSGQCALGELFQGSSRIWRGREPSCCGSPLVYRFCSWKFRGGVASLETGF